MKDISSFSELLAIAEKKNNKLSDIFLNVETFMSDIPIIELGIKCTYILQLLEKRLKGG